MPKPEIEFCDPDLRFRWRRVGGDTLGIWAKILSEDPATGPYTRLSKFPPGIESTETLVHDFWEEVLILQGELVDLAKRETYSEGFCACRAPDMTHGPYRIPAGA